MTTTETIRTETREDPARLYRTARIFADALERRRRKIAAGLPVDPAPRCDCDECREPG